MEANRKQKREARQDAHNKIYRGVLRNSNETLMTSPYEIGEINYVDVLEDR